MAVAAVKESAETCDHAVWGTRLWCPCLLQPQSCPQLPAKEGSAEPATSPGPCTARVASAHPQCHSLLQGAVRKAAQGRRCSGVSGTGPQQRSWPTSRGGTTAAGQAGAVTAALSAAGALCCSASGLTTTLFLTDYIYLLKLKPCQDEAGFHWRASPQRKKIVSTTSILLLN